MIKVVWDYVLQGKIFIWRDFRLRYEVTSCNIDHIEIEIDKYKKTNNTINLTNRWYKIDK